RVPPPLREGRGRPLRGLPEGPRLRSADEGGVRPDPEGRGVPHDLYPEAARAAGAAQGGMAALAGARRAALERLPAHREPGGLRPGDSDARDPVFRHPAALRGPRPQGGPARGPSLLPIPYRHRLREPVLMRILGISAHYHDSAAALVVDGMPVCAVEEERLSR